MAGACEAGRGRSGEGPADYPKRPAQRHYSTESVKAACAMVEDGATAGSVAVRFGVHRSTVARWLRAAGVAPRPVGGRFNEKVPDGWVSWRRTWGWSWTNIAADAGMSRSGVRARYARERERERAGRI